MKKSKIYLLFLCLAACLLTACSKERQPAEGEKEYKIYCLNKSETKVESVSFFTDEEEDEKLITLFLKELVRTPENAETRAAIGGDIQILDKHFEEGKLNLNFKGSYSKMEPTTEVLTRAAIVRTLCQIDAVDYVTFTVEGEPLLNRSSAPVGVMCADQFVENAGNEINTYEKAALVLYFADEDGQALKTIQRNEMYNSNISLERLVVDKIVAGPLKGEGVYPTIKADTKVLSVTLKDGVCYVNLDATFQAQVNNVTAEVTVYSLVNSLIELSNVNKVQISIEGETKIMYKESISLEKPLERNFEIVDMEKE